MLGFLKPRSKSKVTAAGAPVYKHGTLDRLDIVTKETKDGISAACKIQRRFFRKDAARIAEIDQAAENLKHALIVAPSEYEPFKALRAKMQNGKGT